MLHTTNIFCEVIRRWLRIINHCVCWKRNILGELGHYHGCWCPGSGTRFMGPTWGPSGADRTQVGSIMAPWTLLFGKDTLCSIKKGFQICGAPFLLITEVIKTGIVIKAWISNYIKVKEWDVIAQPWPNSPPAYQHWKILGNIWIYIHIHIHIFCSKRTLAHSVYHGHISYRLLLCKYMVDYVSWSRMCEA